MSLYNPKASGLGNSAAYQVAGKPYLTGSAIAGENGVSYITSKEYKVEFPTVARRFTVYNYSNDADLAVYFTPKGLTNGTISGIHFAIVPNKTGSFTMDVKCKEIYISPYPTGHHAPLVNGNDDFNDGLFGVAAELTGIPATDMYELTGSGINVSRYSDGHN